MATSFSGAPDSAAKEMLLFLLPTLPAFQLKLFHKHTRHTMSMQHVLMHKNQS